MLRVLDKVRSKLGCGVDRSSRAIFAILILAAGSSALMSSDAVAASVSFGATGSDTDGSLDATITFTAINGGIKITMSNDESGTGFKRGQSISGLLFSVSGITAPSAFTELQGATFSPGSSWTSGTAFDDTSSASPPNAIDHWGFQATGSNVVLATVNGPSTTGNPVYMILPSSGTAGPGSSLINSNFDPYIVGPANFFLTVPGVTSSTALAGHITNVNVEFGTGPDKTLGTTVKTTPAPLPAPFATGLLLTTGFVGYGLLRKRGAVGAHAA